MRCGGVVVILLLVLGLSAVPSRAQQTTRPSSSPASAPDLLTTIESAPPPTRRAAARDALRRGDADTLNRLRDLLGSADALAAQAVALALGDLAEPPLTIFVEPLFGLLESDRAELRTAAAAALSWRRDADTVQRLIELATNSAKAPSVRSSAIETLREIPALSAAKAIAELLNEPNSEVRNAAIIAMERLAGREFDGDAGAARSWWGAHEQLDSDAWDTLMRDRLTRESRQLQDRVRELEGLLNKALRDALLRTPEAERPTVLIGYLRDPTPRVRLLGLDILQTRLTEGVTPAPETLQRLREMINSPEPDVRTSAIRVLASLRDPADAERFIAILPNETNRAAREALVYALGYCGKVDAAPLLTTLLQDESARVMVEAAVALGRLAERGELVNGARGKAVEALLARSEALNAAPLEARERWLRSLMRICDPAFEPLFINAVSDAAPSPIRAAGARGLAALVASILRNGSASQPTAKTPISLDAARETLRRGLTDAEADVRAASVDAFASLARDADDVDLVWRHAWPDFENDASVRDLAWNAMLALVNRLPPPDVLRWVDCAPSDAANARQRRLDLLLALENRLVADPTDRAALAHAKRRVARERVAGGQLNEAIDAYVDALNDLWAIDIGEANSCLVELLCNALFVAPRDERITNAIDMAMSPIDLDAVWECALGRATSQMLSVDPESVVAAIDLLESADVETSNPTTLAEFTAFAAEARRALVEQDRRVVLDAVARLLAAPQDATTREFILALGRRAAPALAESLREQLASATPSEDAEILVGDMLRSVAPDWPAYDSGASREEKLRSLELFPPLQ